MHSSGKKRLSLNANVAIIVFKAEKIKISQDSAGYVFAFVFIWIFGLEVIQKEQKASFIILGSIIVIFLSK